MDSPFDDLTPTASSPISPCASSLLADNTIVELCWLRSRAPRPLEENSVYVRTGCISDGNCLFHAVSKGLSSTYRKTYAITNEISEESLQKFEEWCPFHFPPELFQPVRYFKGLSSMYRIDNLVEFQRCMKELRTQSVIRLRKDVADHVMGDEKMQSIIKRRLKGRIDSKYMELIAKCVERLLKIGNVVSSQKYIGEFLSGREEQIEKRLEHLASKVGYSIDTETIRDEAFFEVQKELVEELLSGGSVQPDYILLLADYTNTDIYLLRDADLVDGSSSLLYGGSSLHQSILGPLSGRRAIVLLSVDDCHYELVAKYDGNLHPLFTQDEPLIKLLYNFTRTLLK